MINGDFETGSPTINALQSLLNEYFARQHDAVVRYVKIDGRFEENTRLALQRFLNKEMKILNKNYTVRYPIIVSDGIFGQETATAMHLFLFCKGYCVFELRNILYSIINREFQKYLNDNLDSRYGVAINGRFDLKTVYSLGVLLLSESASENSHSDHDEVADVEDVAYAQSTLSYGNFGMKKKTIKALQKFMNKEFAKLNSYNSNKVVIDIYDYQNESENEDEDEDQKVYVTQVKQVKQPNHYNYNNSSIKPEPYAHATYSMYPMSDSSIDNSNYNDNDTYQSDSSARSGTKPIEIVPSTLKPDEYFLLSIC